MIHITLFTFVGLIAISSSSFWNLWVSLELFSFFLMPWLMELEGKTTKTNVFFYFLMQFLASVGLLIGSMTFLNMLCLVLLFSSLLMKMSCFPFHSWFVQILPHLPWEKVIVLTTLSKFIPLVMLGMFMPPMGFMWILISGLTLALGGYQNSCLRSLIAYSSIAHSSWLVICMSMSKVIALSYMLCYILASMPLYLYFMSEGLSSVKAAQVTKKGLIQLVLLTLTLSGIPPFLGFIPKLLAIQTLIEMGAVVEAGTLGILSMLPIYFYFKIGALGLGAKSSTEFQFTYSQSFAVVALIGISLSILLLLLSLSLSLKH